jgi:hypothetical protein
MREGSVLMRKTGAGYKIISAASGNIGSESRKTLSAGAERPETGLIFCLVYGCISAQAILKFARVPVLAALAAISLSGFADAHPGKTDYRNGHKCLKNCWKWNLEFREYHLHDKDWNPIRISRGDPAPEPAPERNDLTPPVESGSGIPGYATSHLPHPEPARIERTIAPDPRRLQAELENAKLVGKTEFAYAYSIFRIETFILLASVLLLLFALLLRKLETDRKR